MAYQTFSGSFIVGRNLVFVHVINDFIQDRFIDVNAQEAFSIRNNVMGSACIKTCDDIAVLVCSDGELGFVPVIKRFFHSYDRLHGWIL